MPVIHVVNFSFKEGTSPEKVKDLCSKVLDLREKCVKATTKQPYMVKSMGGKDMSTEGHQRGMTHTFVMQFESVQDRDYYVDQDEAHHAFIKEAGPHIESAQVTDFEPGVF